MNLGAFPSTFFTANAKEAFLSDVKFVGIARLDGEVFIRFSEDRGEALSFWLVRKSDIKAYRQHLRPTAAAKK
jgi:hypothetical protein